MILFLKNKGNRVFFALFVCVLGLFFLRAWFGVRDSAPFDNEATLSFNEGWCTSDGIPVTLPVKLETAPDEMVRIHRVIPDGLQGPTVLCFRSTQQTVRVTFNGQRLYAFGLSPRPFGKSPGSAWNLVRLPENSAGGVVEISLASPYRLYSGTISEIRMGSKASLLFYLLRSNLMAFVLTVLILMLGMALTIFSLMFRRRHPSAGPALYLGCFALLASLWMLGESKLVQFFANSPFLSMCITFLAMLTFPIALVKYITELGAVSRKKTRGLLCLVLYLQALSVCVLQLFNVADFIEMLPVIQVVFVLCGGVLLGILLAEIRCGGGREVSLSAFALFLLYFFFLLEITWFYTTNQTSTGAFLRLGVLLFICLQGKLAIRRALEIVRLSKEATMDALTGCKNRTAYLAQLEESGKGTSVVMVDLNNLKTINDTLGHEMGDDALSRCARCFSRAFGNWGECYRIGGDEFVFLGRGLDEETLRDRLSEFRRFCEEEDTPYELCAAMGGALFDPDQDQTMTDTVRRADQEMYLQKRRLKKQAD